MERNQLPDTGKEMRCDDGAVIVLHFTPGETTLQDCMVRILSNHISNAVKIFSAGRKPPF